MPALGTQHLQYHFVMQYKQCQNTRFIHQSQTSVRPWAADWIKIPNLRAEMLESWTLCRPDHPMFWCSFQSTAVYVLDVGFNTMLLYLFFDFSCYSCTPACMLILVTIVKLMDIKCPCVIWRVCDYLEQN